MSASRAPLRASRRGPLAAWAIVDLIIWAVALVAATILRYDLDVTLVDKDRLAMAVGGVAVIHLVLGILIGPYLVRHEPGSFEEVYSVTKLVAIVGAVVMVLNFASDPIFVPRSVPVTAAAIALVGMFGARFVIRAMRSGTGPHVDAKRVVVFGAGEGGRQIVRAMLRDPDSQMHPVAILDDDPRKRRLRIDGIRVRGRREHLGAVADREDATTLAIAVPSATPELFIDLRNRAAQAGLELLVLPPASELMGRPATENLRTIDLSDLLGRQPVQLDATAIARCVTGRRVLVTGAGGSIGSELCWQIAKYSPAHLVLLDRDETALQATQLSLTGRGLFEGDDIVLADIRDAARLREVFDAHAPQVVFHAAALKHLSILEKSPAEAWKTNVLGTLNVLRAAQRSGVSTFVNVSTDKAANPTCVLGYSKRLTERLTAGFARQGRGTFVSVRFGNVLGSRGSVIGVFTDQIERGGPVTVTHPQAERFFMLVEEACQLVLQAAAVGQHGDVMVLDMGQPVRINEVANTLISLSGRQHVDIVYTGLRPGEKLREELYGDGETILGSGHPRVSHVPVPGIRPEALEHHQGPPDDEALVLMLEHVGVAPTPAVRDDALPHLS
ncbi:nucleoside-diphosphate sugar epimerase/dehydratase [Janibacter limosus]|uniref:nucleoside-diphosphate sugar epimerase/dehydratase n=1 Tax=Janibacter limosus TaxID=53458 RepID=UPI001F5E71D2|nr:nucleoside-diphosphate sugar epimerase/dehydratase [Janibacter limosus]